MNVPETSTSRLRDALARLGTPAGVHYAGLAIAAIVLLVAATRSWLFFDDFAFVVPSQEHNILQPHVGHWSTLPFLLFLGVRNVFGLDSFLPFAVPVIVAHLAFVHLLWRLMGRVGVAPWIATALGLLVTFFGAGGENILWAFQVGFVGAMALSLGVILILMGPRIGPAQVAGIIVLSILALSSSGTSLPLLACAAVIGWMRHGFLRSLGIFAAPAVAFLVWYLVFGRFASTTGRASGLSEILLKVPAFAIDMVTEGWGRALPVAVVGPLLFVALAVWWVFSIGAASKDARVAYVLFVVAPVFALLTAYSRSGLGIETAVSSRYLYFVIPVMLPLCGVAITALVQRFRLPLVPVLVIIGVVVVYNVGGLAGVLVERMARASETRQQFSAVLDLQDDYDVTSADDGDRVPALQWAPDVLLSDVEIWEAEGWLHPGSYGVAAELTARAVLGLHAASGETPDDVSQCRDVGPEEPAITVDGPRVLVSADSGGGSMDVALSDDGVVGSYRPIAVTADWTEISLEGPSRTRYDLVLDPRAVGVTVCQG